MTADRTRCYGCIYEGPPLDQGNPQVPKHYLPHPQCDNVQKTKYNKILIAGLWLISAYAPPYLYNAQYTSVGTSIYFFFYKRCNIAVDCIEPHAVRPGIAIIIKKIVNTLSLIIYN